MSQYQLLQGDCREVLKTLPDNSVDAIVTDPPYGLEFMGKDWDAPWKSQDVRQPDDPNFTKTDNAYGRSKVRYAMGSSYGGGNGAMVGFQEWYHSVAVEMYRVLKPGGHILSFGGSRTYHRMACAIEDAGFEVRDQMMWVYGSGFPKSHNISKAMDKADGIQPDSEESEKWEGWGTALKPAHEPIVLARKPLDGTVVDNVRKWGVGGLNIDGCRVGDEKISVHNAPKGTFAGGEPDRGSDTDSYRTHTGRWPANLIHDGGQQVLDLFPETQAGNRPAKRNKGFWSDKPPQDLEHERLERGSAARFFYCPKANKRDRDEGCEGVPMQTMNRVNGGGGLEDDPKWKPTERKNIHPTVKPTELMRYLVRLITPLGGTVLDPFNGSGSTGKACMLEGMKYIGIEMNSEYIQIAKARIEAAYAKKENQ